MNTKSLINRLHQAFGNIELPVALWYSSEADEVHDKINGCFFKAMNEVRLGGKLTLSVDTIGCMGGKVYSGYADINEGIAKYVSLKECYKKTPDMVLNFYESLNFPRQEKKYLNFARIDQIENFDNIEGITFFATPDILTGLISWTYFDADSDSAVHTGFNSGCSVVVSRVITENRSNGKRCFLGFFDPSVRLQVEPNILSYSIPMSRLKEMYYTMLDSCLFDTHAWGKVKARINEAV